MNLEDAARVLGVGVDTSGAKLKEAYRVRMLAVHPDVNSRGDAAEQTRLLVDAYRLLSASPVVATAPVPPASPSMAPRPSGAWPIAVVTLVDDDTIGLALPAEEAFRELVAVGHLVGSVTYLDRGGELFETLLTLTDGSTISVLITLQGRASGTTEAFVTVEPLDVRHEAPSVRAVTTLFVHHLADRAAFG